MVVSNEDILMGNNFYYCRNFSTILSFFFFFFALIFPKRLSTENNGGKFADSTMVYYTEPYNVNYTSTANCPCVRRQVKNSLRKNHAMESFVVDGNIRGMTIK